MLQGPQKLKIDDFSPDSADAKPFVKWVGGKRSVIAELLRRVPEKYTSYNECFVGGGAFFFALKPKRAVLSDINSHLVLAYQAIRDDVEGVIEELEQHKKRHSKRHFLKVRGELSSESDAVKVAGYLIYLNKTCYNGLYRVNQSGRFNTPMGSYENPAILDEDNLYNVSEALQGVTIKGQSFEKVRVRKGAFYYLDPPYYEAYNGYSGNRFGKEEHKMLAEKCHEIDAAGGYFLLSNSNMDFIKRLYKGFKRETIKATRYVSCNPDQRGQHSELLIRNYG